MHRLQSAPTGPAAVMLPNGRKTPQLLPSSTYQLTALNFALLAPITEEFFYIMLI
jgi:hypothetical protein